jgi:hypothetical protein
MKYLALAFLLTLTGCADSSTTGNIRGYDIRVDISQNSAPVSLTFPLTVDATSANDQTTENASDIAPDVNLQLVQPGATGSLSGTDSVLKDITSKFQNLLKEDSEQQVVDQLPVEVKPEVPQEVKPEEPVEVPLEDSTELTEDTPVAYETKFHHTQTNGPDPGKSLVLCPDQRMTFDSCSVGDVKIPLHGLDEGREIYWNMTEEPTGDIKCEKDGKTYLYPASTPDSRGFVWGKC